jgi:aspartyl/asparaginyl beta-hydroxylase (cupin superfamily)
VRVNAIAMSLSQRWKLFRRKYSMYNLSSVWNPLFDLWTGGPDRPVFFDIDQTCPALRALDRAYPEIRAELMALLPERDAIPRYHELDTDLILASGRQQRDKSWNVFMLYSYGHKPAENRARCPHTVAALDRIPHLSQAFFSILEGGKSIPAHEGPTRSYLRYHLALRVPRQNPPTIRVADRHYTWQEGESILFDDSWNHQIENRASEPRAVLIVDILRPLPPLPHAFNVLLRHVFGRVYGRKIKKRMDAYRPTRARTA